MTTASTDMTTAQYENTLRIVDKARIQKITAAVEGLKALAGLRPNDDTLRIYLGAVSDHLIAARAYLKAGNLGGYYNALDNAVKLLGSIEAHRPQEAD